MVVSGKYFAANARIIMALQAGWPELDFTSWDQGRADYFAAIQAGLSDYEPMQRLVRQVLRESAQNADD